MISQIGSIAISLAGGLIFSSFIFLGLFKKFNNQTYLQVAERAILATSYCIFLAFFCEIRQLSPIWSIVTAADLEAEG